MRLQELIENEFKAVAPKERYVPDFIENHEGDEGEIKALYDYIDHTEKSMFEQGFMKGMTEGVNRLKADSKTLATEIIQTANNRKRFWFVMFIVALAITIYRKAKRK